VAAVQSTKGPNDSVYKVSNGENLNIDILREFILLSKIHRRSPGISAQQPLETGKDEQKRCYIQFKRIHGETLGELMLGKSLIPAEIQTIRMQVKDIFAKLAAHGLYHGDAGSVSNYMISGAGNDIKVTLVDFVDGGQDPSGQTAREEAKKIDDILESFLISARKTYGNIHNMLDLD
jgi:tRNA A-37 threonylcarbamoyl transferase component Bud32